MRIPMKHAPLAVVALLATTGAELVAQDLLVQAKTIVIAPGSTITDSAFLVRDGKVAYVGDDTPGEARSGARVVDYGDAIISPGFVLAATTLGREADLGETAFAFTPDLRAVEAFDPWQDELLELAQYGVTSVGLKPASRNVAGGVGALVKPGAERGAVAVPEAFAGFSLNSNARSQQRQPTSLMGAKEMLRESFEAARLGVQLGPDLAELRQVMSGARRALVHADTFAELNTALELAETYQFTPVIVGGTDADRVLERIGKSAAGVVLRTLSPTDRIAELTLPKKLAEAGIPFCFAAAPHQLRLSAVLAVRHGLDRRTAHAALTRTPATMLGQQALVGSLRQGCGADFVVHDGDLLDLSARHVATWIDGQLVDGAAPTAKNTSKNKKDS